ncbi:DEAD/DEAH box helicase family protein [Parenemella sanctibonifatiensis]|uniref:Helicase ATP-binding domain-containing protein n=1 Tax=Parenemella sanctibonifatiensis TaxID=2016505 RepID=A0A255EHS0_9ACTN|nr:DEAD/DEAH box helicase family protein [Parenemella sanctibonifatiensis]OYN87673.1 hypothetical protein CGZ92_08235 [Parenemella sanctibonifatiensis]
MTDPDPGWGLPPNWSWRPYQRAALDRLSEHLDGDPGLLVLPAGAGKTAVALEMVRRRGRPAVVFVPTTAIQQQWIAAWQRLNPPPELAASSDRSLPTGLTVLTYQALASFADGDGDVVVDRLAPGAQELLTEMGRRPRLTVVLDECHHLLHTWGDLLTEVLERLPQAWVLGVTATPPERFSVDEQHLAADLFGAVDYAVSAPALVRQGYLSPYAELAWFTTPTPTETAWIHRQGERLAELLLHIADPERSSTALFSWLDLRFVTPRATGAPVDWEQVVRDRPELSDAVLRLHRAGHCGLPDGAVLRERHRRTPTLADWAEVIEDWSTGVLVDSDDPRDGEMIATLRRVLPGVGLQWTRAGIRRGRSPVDRVVARSAAKGTAAASILRHEYAHRAGDLRAVVVCDFEQAATLPADLADVLAPEAGSALGVLTAVSEAAAADDLVAELGVILVSGSRVAGHQAVVQDLQQWIARSDPELAARLELRPDPGPGQALAHPTPARLRHGPANSVGPTACPGPGSARLSGRAAGP